MDVQTAKTLLEMGLALCGALVCIGLALLAPRAFRDRGTQADREDAFLLHECAIYCGLGAFRRAFTCPSITAYTRAHVEPGSELSRNSAIDGTNDRSPDSVATLSARPRHVLSASTASSVLLGVDIGVLPEARAKDGTSTVFDHFTGTLDEFIAAGGLRSEPQA